MSEQASIAFVPVSPVVHRDDPRTSTLSARAVTRDGTRKRQAEAVLAMVRRWPGRTSFELWQLHEMTCRGKCELDRYAFARRLPELADPKNGAAVERGPARRCNRTGKKALTWFPAKREGEAS